MSTDNIYVRISEEDPINIILTDENINVKLEHYGTYEKFHNLLQEYLIQEDLTGEINGIKTDFELINKFYNNSLKVFVNGIKERGVIILSDTEIRILPVISLGSSLEIEYVKKL